MRLLLFSFLFAFVPAIMHFRRTPDSKGSMGNNKSTGSRIGAEPDSESSSGSDNESSDEAAVQVSYQQTLASEVEVMNNNICTH